VPAPASDRATRSRRQTQEASGTCSPTLVDISVDIDAAGASSEALSVSGTAWPWEAGNGVDRDGESAHDDQEQDPPAIRIQPRDPIPPPVDAEEHHNEWVGEPSYVHERYGADDDDCDPDVTHKPLRLPPPMKRTTALPVGPDGQVSLTCRGSAGSAWPSAFRLTRCE
jgi:hypothetical protein